MNIETDWNDIIGDAAVEFYKKKGVAVEKEQVLTFLNYNDLAKAVSKIKVADDKLTLDVQGRKILSDAVANENKVAQGTVGNVNNSAVRMVVDGLVFAANFKTSKDVRINRLPEELYVVKAGMFYGLKGGDATSAAKPAAQSTQATQAAPTATQAAPTATQAAPTATQAAPTATQATQATPAKPATPPAKPATTVPTTAMYGNSVLRGTQRNGKWREEFTRRIKKK